jgi:hypothetical protein
MSEEERIRAVIRASCSYGVCRRIVDDIDGSIEFKTTKRISTVRKLFLGCNVELRTQSPLESSNKYKSEGKYWEYGNVPVGQGCRTDQGKEHVISPVTKHKRPSRDWKPDVQWHFGKAGTGKTTKAKEITTDPFIIGGTLKRWDGYNGQEHVIIENLVYCYDFNELLLLLDSAPYNVRTEDGYKPFLAKKIVVTSLYSPTSLYMYKKEDLTDYYATLDQFDQLRRRITSILRFNSEKCEELFWIPKSPLIVTEKEIKAYQANTENNNDSA